MNPSVTAFIESGVLELYVMGAASPAEAREVERMAAAHAGVRQELAGIRLAMEQYAEAQTVRPRNVVKPFVLASIDYMERMKQGELPASPPLVTAVSRPEDYAAWLRRPDMALPEDADEIFARIIGYTPAAITAIVWIQDGTDKEVHHEEHERFLIVEGVCEITAGEQVHHLSPGSFFDVPLHTPHHVRVISAEPCKAILQRVGVA